MHLVANGRRAAVTAASAVSAVTLLALGLAPVHAVSGSGNTYTPYAVGIKGGEPSISFDPNANAAIYGSATQNKRMTWNDSVTPATVKIEDAKAPTSVTSLDAITFVDQLTHRTFVSQLAAATSLFAFSDDAGKTYTPSQGAGVGTVLDHQSVGGGPFHAPLTGGLGVYPDAVYYCAQNSYNGSCALSPNGGLTFGPAVPTQNTAANDPSDPVTGGRCSALHGHLRVGPDGTAYLPLKGCGGTPTAGNLTNTEYAGGHPSVSVSTDNGTSWLIHRVDGGNNSDESDPSVAAGRGDKFPGGRVYLGWQDGINTPVETGYGTSSAAKIAMSTDDGKTFSAPVDVSTPLGIKNVQFPEVIAGDDDRAAFAWLGTTVAGDDQHNQPKAHPDSIAPGAVWHLYISTTYDGGASFTTVDTTPTNPVQRGCISLQGTSNKTVQDPPCTQRNLLDFNDITVDKQGRALVAYADGCTGACDTDATKPSAGAVDFVMRQSSGPTLYAANDAAAAKAATGSAATGTTSAATAAKASAKAKAAGAAKRKAAARRAAPRQPTRALAFTGSDAVLPTAALLLLGTAVLARRRRRTA